MHTYAARVINPPGKLERQKREVKFANSMWGERQVWPWRQSSFWSCDGSRRAQQEHGFRWERKTERERERARETHEFILWCHISLLQSISHWEYCHKPPPSIPNFTEGGSIWPLPEIFGSVGPLLYDKRTQFATAVVLHTLTSVPKYRQDVTAALWNVAGYKFDWFKGFFHTFSGKDQAKFQL